MSVPVWLSVGYAVSPAGRHQTKHLCVCVCVCDAQYHLRQLHSVRYHTSHSTAVRTVAMFSLAPSIAHVPLNTAKGMHYVDTMMPPPHPTALHAHAPFYVQWASLLLHKDV